MYTLLKKVREYNDRVKAEYDQAREHQDNIRAIRQRISQAKITVTRTERHRMIQVAAYYLAEKRAFQAGHELEDWLEAERCIDAIIERP